MQRVKKWLLKNTNKTKERKKMQKKMAKKENAKRTRKCKHKKNTMHTRYAKKKKMSKMDRWKICQFKSLKKKQENCKKIIPHTSNSTLCFFYAICMPIVRR